MGVTCLVLQKVAGSNVDFQTENADKIFSQSHQTNEGTASHTGKRPVPTACFVMHYTGIIPTFDGTAEGVSSDSSTSKPLGLTDLTLAIRSLMFHKVRF